MAENGESSVGVGFSSSNVSVVVAIPTTRNPDIWKHFDLCKMSRGPNKARCKKCGIFLEADSNSTLKNHIEWSCKVLNATQARGQSSMSMDEDTWNFDVNALQHEMAKFVIQESLPFSYFENPRLTKVVQETIQPRYTPVSGTTLKRLCLKMWKMVKNELILGFENLESGVNLTCDVWKAPYNIPESYLCVTAHWVDPNTWQMMKRTISFELFPYPHTGDDLFEILDEVITTYKLTNKLFSVSFDNVSNNIDVVAQLKVKCKPICNDIFFHNKCVAQVINLGMQDMLKHIEYIKEPFKQMLCDIFSHSKERYLKYRKFCRDRKSIWLGPNWEIPTRWDTTCSMFECALRQKNTLQMFHDNLVELNLVVPFPASSWTLIEQLTDMLKVFKKATSIFSGVYYPTSSLILKEMWKMTTKISEYELKSQMFLKMVRPMKDRFIEYFKDIPPVITCAAALNPCLNAFGVEILIEKIAHNLGLEKEDTHFSANAKANFNRYLSNMFDIYLLKYGSTSSDAASSDGGSGNGKTDERYMLDLYNSLIIANCKWAVNNTPSTELEMYIRTDFFSAMTPQDFKNFDVLAWWKKNASRFPVLAAMARDLLTVQASTVALESVFSVSGRVVSLGRTRLFPTTLEMCICLKDHLDASERKQHISILDGDTSMEAEIHTDEEISSEDDE